ARHGLSGESRGDGDGRVGRCRPLRDRDRHAACTRQSLTEAALRSSEPARQELTQAAEARRSGFAAGNGAFLQQGRMRDERVPVRLEQLRCGEYKTVEGQEPSNAVTNSRIGGFGVTTTAVAGPESP